MHPLPFQAVLAAKTPCLHFLLEPLRERVTPTDWFPKGIVVEP